MTMSATPRASAASRMSSASVDTPLVIPAWHSFAPDACPTIGPSGIGVDAVLPQRRHLVRAGPRKVEAGRPQTARPADDAPVNDVHRVNGLASAIACTVTGAMALHSTNSGRIPTRRAASATSPATTGAASDASTESTMSDCRTTSSIEPTSSTSAAAAFSRVRSLRPSSVDTTLVCADNVRAMALPISPIPSRPIVEKLIGLLSSASAPGAS